MGSCCQRVTVFGYGACGRGVAACFRNAFSVVSVVDVDPVTTLEAHLDGLATPVREEAIRNADSANELRLNIKLNSTRQPTAEQVKEQTLQSA